MTGLGATLAVVLATIAPQAERVEVPAVVPVPAGHVRVSGTVVARDAKGSDATDAAPRAMDGTLLFSPGPRQVERVVIRGGRWEAIVANDRPFKVLALTLEGRALECVKLSFEPPFERPLELVAPWRRGRTIDVVDAASGAPLEGIELIEDLSRRGERLQPWLLPPEWTILVDGRSPILLPSGGGYYVSAPGRVWRRVVWHDLPHGHRVDRIELPLACSLTVVVSGGDRARPITLLIESQRGLEEAQLRIQALADGQVVVDRIDFDEQRFVLPADGRIVLDRLPPGRILVTALLDFDSRAWSGHRVVLGEGVATLTPGKLAELSLPLAATPPGLDDDGEVERMGRVVAIGTAGPSPFQGSGEFTFTWYAPPRRRVDETDLPASETLLGELLGRRGGDGSPMMRGKATIRGGKFELRVPYGCRLQVDSLRLEKRDYDLGNRHQWPVLDTTREPIKLAWPLDAPAYGDLLPFTLRVVDAQTKVDLGRAHVVLGDHGKPPDSRLHPGVPAPDDHLVAATPSPFRLPLPRGKPKWKAWAGADGYAWAPFQFDREGSALVQLEPAADLVVVFANESLPKGTRVEVRRIPARDEVELTGDRERVAELAPWWSGATPLPDSGHGERVADAPIGDAPTMELTGVPRGFLLVALAIHGSEGTRWLGFTPVDTRVGGRHEVALAARESLLPLSSRMSGTLVVPPEWNAARPTLAFSPHAIELLADRDPVEIPRSELRAIEGTPGLYAWECGPLMNGTWVAELDEFGVAQSIALGPDGRDDVAIVVPPPAELRVQCVDGITGAPVDVQGVGLALALTRDAPTRGIGRHRQERVGSLDRFVLRAPVGTVDLDVHAKGYAPLKQSVVVPAGGADLTLRFWRPLGIKVRWTEGDAAIELRAGRATRVTDVDGIDVLLNVPDSWPRGMTLELSRPGRHRITFPHLRGYRRITPLDVDTRAGEYVEVAVELVAEE